MPVPSVERPRLDCLPSGRHTFRRAGRKPAVRPGVLRPYLAMLVMAAWSIFALQPSTAHPGDSLDFSRALRVDFELGGDAAGVGVFFRSLKQEPHWAGPLSHPVDPFDYGSYRFRVYAAQSGELLFSQGFSGLFEEWQVTAESAHRHRSFQHAARFPFPKVPVRFVLEIRRRDTGRFVHLAQRTIDPADPLIVREPPANCRVHPLRIAGTPGESLDIAVIAEGYQEREMGKFRKDAVRLTDYLLQQEPFRSHRHRISIRAVEAISQESGTDVPSESIYRNTALNSSYSTFGVERYLTVPEAWRIYDYAAAAPCDQVFVLVNTPALRWRRILQSLYGRHRRSPPQSGSIRARARARIRRPRRRIL
jgi:hypothetical protein